MEAMAQEWTEGRLDELSRHVDRGFDQVDQRFEKVEAEIVGLRLEMRTEFTEMRTEFTEMRSEMKGDFDRVNARIDSVQRTIAFGAVALTGAILAGFAAICTLIATTL